MSALPVYAGSFDPITKGHVSVIKRAINIFGDVQMLVAMNPDKQGMFSTYDRADLIQLSMREEGINSFKFSLNYITDGFVVDRLSANSHVLIRGIRKGAEVEYERQIADFNRNRSRIETVFLLAEPELSEVSSTMLKVMVQQGLDVSKFCTKVVEEAIKAKIK